MDSETLETPETLEPILDPRRYTLFRLDGHTFSSLVRKEKLTRPFDESFSASMREAAEALFEEHRFWRAFVGSDEITVVWKPLTTDQLTRGATLAFGGRTQKLVSLLAGFVSVAFFRAYLKAHPDTRALPHFDCRCFQVETALQVRNALMERAVFTLKNARMMFAQHYLSAKQLHGLPSSVAVKKTKEMFGADFYRAVHVYNRVGGFLERTQITDAFVIPGGPQKGQTVARTRSVGHWVSVWEGEETSPAFPLPAKDADAAAVDALADAPAADAPAADAPVP